ncbi:unnamed protein product [Lactuca virosa]|uniref:ABC1 atypical kinase-like domain-containing protein n=1 Tax=Lactuca virosa TaxID=75947 RepID=A0AAU9LT18_9ASTR|nr:unnamed protein product [Lactuca virosa]
MISASNPNSMMSLSPTTGNNNASCRGQQASGLNTYFKTPERRYKLKYEKSHLAGLLHYAHGKSVTQRIIADGYDPASISAYWGKRPRAVATRITQLTSVAGGFLSRLTWDEINKKVKENEVSRAIELREIVTSLGPTYIKLGQALSIRPYILFPATMTKLQKLCDKVPSYPDNIAMTLLEEELGEPWQNIYSELTTSPIAAASLGQVYKGRLKENGDLVAVKISLDVVGLVDAWVARFFEEIDYINEGENGTYYAEMMKKDLPQCSLCTQPECCTFRNGEYVKEGFGQLEQWGTQTTTEDIREMIFFPFVTEVCRVYANLAAKVRCCKVHYTDDDIDEICEEWSTFVTSFIYR